MRSIQRIDCRRARPVPWSGKTLQKTARKRHFSGHRRERDRLKCSASSTPIPFQRSYDAQRSTLQVRVWSRPSPTSYSDKLTRKDVKGLLESIVELGHAELKKNGIFVLPGLVRMVVVKKPATKERKGINPFTGEPTVFKAKPARKVIKARPVKAAKDAIG